MPAETAIRALLMQSSAITTLVGDRCHPVEVPIGMDLPALATRHISTVDAGTVDAAAPYSLQSSRIEVRAVAQSYPAVQQLLAAIKAACQYQRGTVAGTNLVSILRDITGPAIKEPGEIRYEQTVDFIVTWRGANN